MKFHKLKRFFLPLCLCPILLILHPVDWMEDLWFIILDIFISCYILFLNFPHLIEKMYTKPIYFEDLKLLPTEKLTICKPSNCSTINFQIIFTSIQQFTTAIIVSICFVLYKDKINTTNPIELAGIIGGLIYLITDISNKIGIYLLEFLNWYKLKYQITISEDSIQNESIERKSQETIE